MKFRINFTWPDGTEDSFIVTGETLEECQAKAADELGRRQGSNPWSEELEG